MSSSEPTGAACDYLAVCVHAGVLDRQKPVSTLNRALAGALFEQAKRADFQAKPEQTLEMSTAGRIKAKTVLLVGVGSSDKVDGVVMRAVAAIAARAANAGSAKVLGFCPPERPDLRALGEGLELGAYRFVKYLTGDRRPKTKLGKVVLLVAGKPRVSDRRALDIGQRIGEAVNMARDAVNEPPNALYPASLAALARQVARQHRLRIRVLERPAILRAGMKLLYAVGQGSAHEPRFIHLSYVPKRSRGKLAFVGKGLTFDSGGLSIKPAPGMGEMKADMGGAAAVLGLMGAVGVVRPPVEVHGLIGSAENMPDGAAYRPGDVFGSLSGKTVEIINTDAEGRLVLADVLSYASRLKPDVVLDAATLTGAMVVALGKTCAGYYATDDALAQRLETAAREAGESFWRMPLLEELTEQLKSDVADLKHTGERYAGAITAALFLREFVAKVPWIHCDIAGTAFTEKARSIHPKGGTAHALLTFLRFVENTAKR
ncbi:MAG TPA: leucyl aminopeptidase [Polyangiaceae bacterium]